MANTTTSTKAIVIPTLSYKDAPKAVEWLCKAFGFEKHLVVPGENDTISHAQLVVGNSMIMVSSSLNSEFDQLQKSASELGGVVSQSAYIFVDDADAHCAQAVAAGAEVVIQLADASYGGRGYSCRDLEGNLWNFGTYNPWTAQ